MIGNGPGFGPVGPSSGGSSSSSSSSTLPRAGKFPFLHRALAQVQQGAHDRTILLIGDSITEGVFANLGVGPVAGMVKALNGAGINSQFGLSGAAASSVTIGSDGRWSKGTGWSFSNSTGGEPTGWGAAGCAYQGAPSASGHLTYTPATDCDTFDVWYFDTSTEGFTIAASGGTPVVVTTGGTGTMKKATCVAAVASALNVLTISAPTGFGCSIFGVDARLSTAATLRVGNVGAIGSTSVSWIGGTVIGPTGAAMIGVYAPDVSIISLGVNDMLGLDLPVATFLANLATLAAACAASGDVIFWSEVPITTADLVLATQSGYYAALSAFCAANGYGFLDTYSAWGTAAQFANLNTDGYYADNLIHPSTFGQYDLGRTLAAGLLAA